MKALTERDLEKMGYRVAYDHGALYISPPDSNDYIQIFCETTADEVVPRIPLNPYPLSVNDAFELGLISKECYLDLEGQELLGMEKYNYE
ncbi:hypothetical protein N9137_00915 [Pseudomonadales bacterium]|nr:hypothetical protein [Pseudomonadales bacterium]